MVKARATLEAAPRADEGEHMSEEWREGQVKSGLYSCIQLYAASPDFAESPYPRVEAAELESLLFSFRPSAPLSLLLCAQRLQKMVRKILDPRNSPPAASAPRQATQLCLPSVGSLVAQPSQPQPAESQEQPCPGKQTKSELTFSNEHLHIASPRKRPRFSPPLPRALSTSDRINDEVNMHRNELLQGKKPEDTGKTR